MTIPNKPDTPGIRVLVVDDNRQDYLLARYMLAESLATRYEADWVETYEAGRAALGTGKYDVCLLDYRLAARDGLELLREVRGQGCRVPIILLTGLDDDEIDRAAMHAGATDYLVKGALTFTLLDRVIRYAVERKRVEFETQRRLRFQAELLDAVGQAVIATDLDSRVLYCNQAAERLYGLTMEEALGRDVAELNPASVWRQAKDRILESLRRGERWSGDSTVQRRDGTTVPTLVTVTPLHDDGELAGMIAVAVDVTERAALEQKLRQSQKLEAIGQLAGGVAHDFNNMLAVISGYTELALAQAGDSQLLQSYLSEVSRAGERAAGLTRQLLVFSRNQILEPRVVDLGAVVASAQVMLRRLIGEDIELVTLTDERLSHVKVDPGQVEQVLMNLVVNARDAMPRGGKIVIETHNCQITGTNTGPDTDLPPGNYVLLVVADTGSGMDAATLAHVFEPFFTTKVVGKGTGLGLATVYGIVQQSGGEIRVYSTPGVGTTFRIYLPWVDEEVTPEPEPEALALPCGNETILVAEDEPMVRRYTCDVLRGCGYTVLEATEGEEGVRIAEQYPGPIHLLVTDLVMPRMSGRALAEHLTPLRLDLRVIFISGYTSDSVVQHGVYEATVAFLQKPFLPLTLAQKVREILDGAPADTRTRILFVDDDVATRESVAEALRHAGYRVATAGDGLEALEYLRTHQRPDLLLIDLVMPRMNGWVFRTEQLKVPEFADIPVIVLSGVYDPDPASHFLAAVESLRKPFEVPDLCAAIERLSTRHPTPLLPTE